jgi:hypothetical protein
VFRLAGGGERFGTVRWRKWTSFTWKALSHLDQGSLSSRDSAVECTKRSFWRVYPWLVQSFVTYSSIHEIVWAKTLLNIVV